MARDRPGTRCGAADAGPGEIDAFCAELASRHLLSEVLIRNRKAVVGGFMPRRAVRWEVDLRDG